MGIVAEVEVVDGVAVVVKGFGCEGCGFGFVGGDGGVGGGECFVGEVVAGEGDFSEDAVGVVL